MHHFCFIMSMYKNYILRFTDHVKNYAHVSVDCRCGIFNYVKHPSPTCSPLGRTGSAPGRAAPGSPAAPPVAS